MKLFHKNPIFETVKWKVIISLFETVRLSVSISPRNLYDSLKSLKERVIMIVLLYVFIMKIVDFVNSEDPNEVAHCESPHPDLHCFLSSSISVCNMI